MRARLVFFVTVVLLPCAAWPQGDPVGPEFRVNTYTPNTQRAASVAAAASGDFVVVWGSYRDGSLYGVFGQRYASSGVPTGPEFRVNTFTSGPQSRPVVAADTAGNFVVVWQSQQDGSAYGIFGQRYAATGTSLGPEFRVNTYTANTQGRPAVAADSLGNFVVVWQSFSQDGSYYGVFGQRFAGSGIPLGPEFRANTAFTGASQQDPSVASDSSGNFIVTWEGNLSIWGQRYSSSGAPIGPNFIVNSSMPPFPDFNPPAVASDATGNFVVVWDMIYLYGTQRNVFGRRFASNGGALGSQFRVNTHSTSHQYDPVVAADASGNFVVAWVSLGQDGYGASAGVFGQRYASSGAPLGPEFRVNTYTTQGQSGPAVAADPAGNFIVAWTSDTQDGSGSGIFAQRYSMIVPVELMHYGVE